MDREEISNARLRWIHGGGQNCAGAAAAIVKVDKASQTDATLGESRCLDLFERVTSQMERMSLEFQSVKGASQSSKNAVEDLKGTVGNLTTVQNEMIASQQKIIDQVENANRMNTGASGSAVATSTNVVKYDAPNSNAWGMDMSEQVEDIITVPSPKPNDCGICHKDAVNNMVVNSPCGHFPYCVECVNALQDARNNIPLLERDDDWGSFRFLCPQCTGRVQETFRVRKVKPDDGPVTL